MVVCPHVCWETRLSWVLVKLLIFVCYLRSDLWRSSSVSICQTASHFELHSLSVSASQSSHHSGTSSCSRLVTNHSSLVIMKSLDFKQWSWPSILILRFRISQHKTLSSFLINFIKLIKQISKTCTLSMSMTFDIRIINLFQYFLHSFNSIFKRFLQTRTIKHQITNFSPFIIYRICLLYCRYRLWKSTSSNEKLSVQLTIRPISGEKFRWVKSVCISWKHNWTCPKTPHSV